MNLSSTGTASSMTSAFLSEPPLSPGPAPQPADAPMPSLRTVEPAAPVTPAEQPVAAAAPITPPAAPPAAPKPSLESTLLRMRLVTPDQIASAMREEAETGRPLAEIVVANGWVSADDLAKLETPAATVDPAPTPAPAPDPAPVAPAPAAVAPAPAPAAVAPAPEPAPAPAPAPVPTPAPAAAPAAAPAPTANTPQALAARVLVRLENGERIEVGTFDEPDVAKKRARSLMAELRQAAEWPFLSGRYVRPEAIVSIDIDLTGF